VRGACLKAYELGIISESEYKEFDEGLKNEWEISDKTE
jgi:hypothetical protein